MVHQLKLYRKYLVNFKERLNSPKSFAFDAVTQLGAFSEIMDAIQLDEINKAPVGKNNTMFQENFKYYAQCPEGCIQNCVENILNNYPNIFSKDTYYSTIIR